MCDLYEIHYMFRQRLFLDIKKPPEGGL